MFYTLLPSVDKPNWDTDILREYMRLGELPLTEVPLATEQGIRLLMKAKAQGHTSLPIVMLGSEVLASGNTAAKTTLDHLANHPHVPYDGEELYFE